MKLSEFKLNIPRASIADTPADPRSESKMMVVNPKTGAIDDRTVKDLVKIAKRGDCIVLNETKVFPASFHGIKEKTNANIDVMLLRELNKPDNIWDVLVEPARKVRIGNKIYFDDGRFYCEIIDNTTARGRTVRFSYQGDLFDEIKRIGDMALPEYVRREIEFEDKARYQTEYANENFLSSIAPPSAGLFVTQDMIEKLEAKGVRIAKVTTNLGLEIFETIEVEDISKYRMYSEYFEISPEAAETINKAIKSKKEIIAIGSSTVRALESSVLTTSIVKANKGWTDRYIYPNYDFRIPTKLLTTFHPMFTTSVLLSIFVITPKKQCFWKAILFNCDPNKKKTTTFC
ncbi:MAG: tRNA preQ1(34) S-adenosylmethionine ribosyltransferase-isomerase QueA [Bacteroidetes bacterium 4572_77]|nr:MAG: tRNA preQ1(34) S-adenosylmethionine ribosyltransferase-isomerase QueA [Bacteroidetes bacterium 4572_77]